MEMMSYRGMLFFLAACAALASGCARSSVRTSVDSDGSWIRTLKFRGSSETALQDRFVLPSGESWKISRAPIEDGVLYSARRALLPGQTLQRDLVLLNAGETADEQIAANEVTVRTLAPGRWEYREVLRWRGARPKEILEPDPRLTQVIHSSLSQALPSSAAASDLARSLQREAWRIAFGPGHSLLGVAAAHPDLWEYQMRQRIGSAAERLLTERFGERLTESQRHGIALLLASSTFAVLGRSETVSAIRSGQIPAALVPLSLTVSLPGTIVTTNGEIDGATGEVFWAIYAGAAMIEDLVLTAIGERTLATREGGGSAAPRQKYAAFRPERPTKTVRRNSVGRRPVR
jgi:hypothetical protein